jgi:hypothetical protein
MNAVLIIALMFVLGVFGSIAVAYGVPFVAVLAVITTINVWTWSKLI